MTQNSNQSALNRLFPSANLDKVFDHKRKGRVAVLESPPRKDNNYRKSSVYKRGSGLSSKNKAIGVVLKTPEVMIKVDHLSSGIKTVAQLKQNAEYISRNGNLEVEDQDGNKLDRAELKDLMYGWSLDQDIPEDKSELTTKRTADARRIVISCPKECDPEKVIASARQFGREFFAENGFDYVFVAHIHDPEHPKEPDHPHVHFMVKTLNCLEQRLYITQVDLQFMRERFAAIAREHGLSLNATSRAVRGNTSRSKSSERYYLEQTTDVKPTYQQKHDQEIAEALRQGKPLPDCEPIKQAKITRTRVLDAAKEAVEELRQSTDERDHVLASELEKHFETLEPVQSIHEKRYNAAKALITQRQQEREKQQERKLKDKGRDIGGNKQQQVTQDLEI